MILSQCCNAPVINQYSGYDGNRFSHYMCSACHTRCQAITPHNDWQIWRKGVLVGALLTSLAWYVFLTVALYIERGGRF
jgi:hypothetical protein